MDRQSMSLPPAGGSPCALSLALAARRRRFAGLICFALLRWASSAEPLPAASPPVPPIAPPGSARPPSSGSELDRLAEISRRLAELNERLRIELESSRLSSAGLAASLESSMAGLEALRSELEASRRTSSELARSAEISARESSELREALRRADDSLRSLETSFEDYRKAAEARIRRAERGRFLAWLAAAAGWLLAALSLLAR